MKNVIVTKLKLTIPTYPEPEYEQLPMFAENRVHQRTSGNPYPNKIVLQVDRREKKPVDYTCIRLENEYIRLEILPELGGRIYSAYDKTTGYNFFYKQHVIKPALIGCLGSWISGGLEFNWPFHHRASTYMPVDYEVEQEKDGTVTVWLSEHDPIDRMKGTYGIRLRPDMAAFETCMRLTNRTPVRHSFLWWENAAVPVNKDYQIFYPKDVQYVNFHYKRSVTTFPVASNAMGIFNGIRFEKDTDISMHKNTVQPTSYFCAPSDDDFFGGFDHGKKCGVVHIANHHTATGKKMFTWGYNQLSRSWEKALTDTDGAYAELMAGSFSDNQPDFSFIEPYETKCFSQHWYPIGNVGPVCYATLAGAIGWTGERLTVQLTKDTANAKVLVYQNGETVFTAQAGFKAGIPQSFSCKCAVGRTVRVIAEQELLCYTEQKHENYNIPETTKDRPVADTVQTAQELYLEGVHLQQYRDPAEDPAYYWQEALRRDPAHVQSLIALADLSYRRCNFKAALAYIERAEQAATHYNKRPESGRLYYTKALILRVMGRDKQAYDYFWKASWNLDYYAAAMVQIAALDGKNKDYEPMKKHAVKAQMYHQAHPLAGAYEVLALLRLGETGAAKERFKHFLQMDPLNHLLRFLGVWLGVLDKTAFYLALHSNPAETALDLYFDLTAAGAADIGTALLKGLDIKTPMVNYLLGDDSAAEKKKAWPVFPARTEEYCFLQQLVERQPELVGATYAFGCLCYAKKQYEKAAELFLRVTALAPDYADAYRNLAVAYYSHLNRGEEAMPLLEKAYALHPQEQLAFEILYLANKTGTGVLKAVNCCEALLSTTLRDDIYIELAKAYNLQGEYDKAIALLSGHAFVPCEGGEHAVADQYMWAWFAKGRMALAAGQTEQALSFFKNAQILPENLGAGLWHEVKLVPHQYYEALCHLKLGNETAAHKIFQHIRRLKIDYFSNMHLKELPLYQAMIYRQCGDALTARALIDQCIKQWQAAITVKDSGSFGTTPFFISYIENPANAREACYRYLLGFAKVLCNLPQEAELQFKRVLCLDASALPAKIELLQLKKA